jgi:glycosyltransferase involved in cell wall biosynthesis
MARLSSLFFFPDYKGNSYLNLIYSHLGVAKIGIGFQDDNSELIDASRSKIVGPSSVLHLHWINELYLNKQRCLDQPLLIKSLNAIENFKRKGSKVALTLHNISPHDCTPHELTIYRDTLSKVISISNLVFQHSDNAASMIAKLHDLPPIQSNKLVTIGHPLYSINENFSPVNPIPKLKNRSYVLMFGTIKQYKNPGAAIDAYKYAIKDFPGSPPYLVIAGRIRDPYSKSLIDEANRQLGSKLIILDKVLLDNELDALIRDSLVCIQPYSKTLTSGSFYHALTHKRLCIVPLTGEFACSHRPDYKKYPYFTDQNHLRQRLYNILRKDKFEIEEWGESLYELNLQRRSDLVSKSISKELYRLF